MSNMRVFLIPPSISKSFKNVSHLKMEGARELIMPSPSLETITRDKLEDTIISNVDSRYLFRVKLVDNITRETHILHLVEDNNNRILVNKKHRVMGVYQNWTESHVPEYYKNKDGIIVDPDSGGELMEFTLFPGKEERSRTYREYNYLPEHDALQKSWEVEILE